MSKENTEIKKEKTLYNKESILKSKKYDKRKDLLNALLKENENYSFEQIDSMVDKFMKGKVS